MNKRFRSGCHVFALTSGLVAAIHCGGSTESGPIRPIGRDAGVQGTGGRTVSGNTGGGGNQGWQGTGGDTVDPPHAGTGGKYVGTGGTQVGMGGAYVGTGGQSVRLDAGIADSGIPTRADGGRAGSPTGAAGRAIQPARDGAIVLAPPQNLDGWDWDALIEAGVDPNALIEAGFDPAWFDAGRMPMNPGMGGMGGAGITLRFP